MDTYECINDTDNLLSALILRIKSEPQFKENTDKLINSNDAKDNDKAKLINNTIENIRVFGTKKNPLFLAKDIGILLGISAINITSKSFSSDEKIDGFIQVNNKNKKVIFLTRYGLYRCFYASRSPLSGLFRKYICDLIDYMLINEHDLLSKITEKFKTDNINLIEKSINDLNEKVIQYSTELIKERELTDKLKSDLEKSEQLIVDKKNELVEYSTKININEMIIEQLKKDKLDTLNRIKNIKQTDKYIDEKSEIEELALIKEKFMKPIIIYILHPDIISKLLKKIQKKENKDKTKKKELLDDSADENIPQNNELIEFMLKDMDSYTKNFNNIYEDIINTNITSIENFSDLLKIDNDELLYYHISFSKTIINDNKSYYINTKWVCSKKHIDLVLKSISDDTGHLKLGTYTLYKTSLNELDDLIREKLMEV